MVLENPELAFIGLLVLFGSASIAVYLLFQAICNRHSRHPTSDSQGNLTQPKDFGAASDMDVVSLKSSLGASPDAILLAGSQWQLSWANTTACLWFGIDLNRDIEQPIEQIMTISGFDEFLSLGEFSQSFECIAPANSGVRLEIRVAPYHSGQYLMQGRDITKFRQLEQIRRDFVSNASHELRTPLSILYGYLEMMRDEPDESISPQWKGAVSQMFEQTCRIKQIIDDMMLLSRLEDVDVALEQQYIPMAPVLHSAYKDAKALSAPKHHNVVCEIDENYSLFCNFNEINSLISNLVSNAIRYTQAGGDIAIKWEVDVTGGKLSVKDTGIGIEEENIPRLTERFYRTDSARSRAAGGTGLGLAIVNHIVSRHNANLMIHSVVGQGSVFMVQFPNESIRADHDQVKLLLN